jgi:hypothetical protein
MGASVRARNTFPRSPVVQAASQMKPQPDRISSAQHYANCARANIIRAERAISAKERAYYVAVAREYLLLAANELRTPRQRRTIVSRRKAL